MLVALHPSKIGSFVCGATREGAESDASVPAPALSASAKFVLACFRIPQRLTSLPMEGQYDAFACTTV